jgi:hypothetical protein
MTRRTRCFLSALVSASALVYAQAPNAQPPGVQPTNTSGTRAAAPAPPALPNRLFSDPAERVQLDKTRPPVPAIVDESTVVNESTEPPFARVAPSVQAAPTPTLKPRTPVINGFVKRSDGVATVWVNDVPRHNPDAEWLANLEPNDVGGDVRAIKKNNSNVVKAEKRKKKSRVAVPRAKKVRR